MPLTKSLYNLFADLGDWLEFQSRQHDAAIILVVISLLTPMGFLFSAAFIASAYRKKKKRR